MSPERGAPADVGREDERVEIARLIEWDTRNQGDYYRNFSERLASIDPIRHREVVDFLMQQNDSMAIRMICQNLPHFRDITPQDIIERLLASNYTGEGGIISDETLALAQVDHAWFIDRVKQAHRSQAHRWSSRMTRNEEGIIRNTDRTEEKRGIWNVLKLRDHKPAQGGAKVGFPEVERMLRSDGYVPDGMDWRFRSERIKNIQLIYDLLDWVDDWEKFLSRQVVGHYERGDDTYTRLEFFDFEYMYKRLSELISPEDIKLMADECRADDIVEFVKKFMEAGRTRIIERITQQQQEFFDVDSGAEVWRYGNIEGMDMDEYLRNLKDRDKSSGRLLVHVTKDNLFGRLIEDQKLKSVVAVHIAGIGKGDSASIALASIPRTGPESGEGFKRAFGLSVAVHFSFDDAIEYPMAQFACVFSSEALFNNYAYLEMDKHAMRDGNDVAFGGLTNDYFNDSTHEIDVKKYGFFLVPRRYENTDIGNQLREKGLRVFYYDGNLQMGMAQLRKKIGTAEKKPKLVRSLRFQRRIGVEHRLEANSARDAQICIAMQLENASEAARRGVNIFPENDNMLYHIGKGGGKGNYFAA